MFPIPTPACEPVTPVPGLSVSVSEVDGLVPEVGVIVSEVGVSVCEMGVSVPKVGAAGCSTVSSDFHNNIFVSCLSESIAVLQCKHILFNHEFHAPKFESYCRSTVL